MNKYIQLMVLAPLFIAYQNYAMFSSVGQKAKNGGNNSRPNDRGTINNSIRSRLVQAAAREKGVGSEVLTRALRHYPHTNEATLHFVRALPEDPMEIVYGYARPPFPEWALRDQDTTFHGIFPTGKEKYFLSICAKATKIPIYPNDTPLTLLDRIELESKIPTDKQLLAVNFPGVNWENGLVIPGAHWQKGYVKGSGQYVNGCLVTSATKMIDFILKGGSVCVYNRDRFPYDYSDN